MDRRGRAILAFKVLLKVYISSLHFNPSPFFQVIVDRPFLDADCRESSAHRAAFQPGMGYLSHSPVCSSWLLLLSTVSPSQVACLMSTFLNTFNGGRSCLSRDLCQRVFVFRYPQFLISSGHCSNALKSLISCLERSSRTLALLDELPPVEFRAALPPLGSGCLSTVYCLLFIASPPAFVKTLAHRTPAKTPFPFELAGNTTILGDAEWE